jgi:hypothetical protein
LKSINLNHYSNNCPPTLVCYYQPPITSIESLSLLPSTPTFYYKYFAVD